MFSGCPRCSAPSTPCLSSDSTRSTSERAADTKPPKSQTHARTPRGGGCKRPTLNFMIRPKREKRKKKKKKKPRKKKRHFFRHYFVSSKSTSYLPYMGMPNPNPSTGRGDGRREYTCDPPRLAQKPELSDKTFCEMSQEAKVIQRRAMAAQFQKNNYCFQQVSSREVIGKLSVS